MKKILSTILICSAFSIQAETLDVAITDDTASSDQTPLAQDSRVINPYFAFGLTFGGDDMTYTTGRSLKAGGLLYGVIGAVYHPNPNFDVQASIGFHLDGITAQNGDTSFTRAVVELIPFYVMDSGFRIGLGLTRAISPEYTYDDGTTRYTTSFDDATGVLLQFDMKVLDNDWLGVRFAGIEFENDNTVEPIDGGYIGFIYQLNM